MQIDAKGFIKQHWLILAVAAIAIYAVMHSMRTRVGVANALTSSTLKNAAQQ